MTADDVEVTTGQCHICCSLRRRNAQFCRCTNKMDAVRNMAVCATADARPPTGVVSMQLVAIKRDRITASNTAVLPSPVRLCKRDFPPAIVNDRLTDTCYGCCRLLEVLLFSVTALPLSASWCTRTRMCVWPVRYIRV